MNLLEIQKQAKHKRRYRNGEFVVEVKLEHPGDEHREFLKVRVMKENEEVAKGLFKNWHPAEGWQALNVQKKNKTAEDMMYKALRHAGYRLK